jgi:hypothetical protein
MQHKRNKIRLALVGSPSAPKLFNALQIAQGITGDWNKIIVIGSSSKDIRYQHIGSYNTLSIPIDATPQRYSDLLNLCAGCNKEVIIFSTLSEEWKSVTQHLNSSYYQEVLKAHRHLFNSIRHSPVNVIACVDSKKKFSCTDTKGNTRLNFRDQHIQCQSFERNFNIVLRVSKRGTAEVGKDLSNVLPLDSFKISAQIGAMLHDYCYRGNSVISPELQHRINACCSLSELYQLLFDLDIEEEELFQAFAKRRLELENMFSSDNSTGFKPSMDILQGGQP